MSDMYLTIKAVERIEPKELRVYGVEKGKEEQNNYEQAAQAVNMKKTRKAEAAAGEAEYRGEMEAVSQKYGGDIYSDMIQIRKNSLENRQQQLAFEKTVQTSRARTIRAAAAYESSFLVY